MTGTETSPPVHPSPPLGPVVPDGIVAVVKHECETCVSIVPVLAQLRRAGVELTVYTQDDPGFPDELPDVVDDTELRVSWALDLVTVPTLLRFEGGVEAARTEGWHRPRWEELTGIPGLGRELPELRPGCGSRTADPNTADELAARFGSSRLRARRVSLGSSEDDVEAAFERGWTDGLPVVPPTETRVLRMLAGTTRRPDEVVAIVPPDLVECTVEKVAINAVMAGCRPEYLPVVLTAVEAMCTDEFNGHGLLATTYFSGPVVIVNGPIRQAIGMNSGGNVLGQGNRANATIGRALQLTVRNVGGGVPGGVDRATLGNPGKYTFSFAEDEEGSPWESLAVERGLDPGRSAVTLFAGEGPRGVIDQLSRRPESLARSFAGCLRTVGHHKLALGFDAMLVVSPEHGRVFRQAGWTKARLRDELLELLTVPGAELVRGAGGCDEGLPEGLEDAAIPKFRPDGLWFVHAGGRAGLFSSIIGSWINGPGGSQPVTREVVV
jgi:hypothetical protein